MSTEQLNLSEWVDHINKLIFFQPDDAISTKAIEEHVDPNLVVKVNHNVFTYEQFKGGVQFLRSSQIISLDTNSHIMKWENPEKPDGAVVRLTTFTNTEKATGKVSKKKNIEIHTVKVVDGKRKLTELVEVEDEEHSG